ncbi:MAG: type I-C CRISPR-associated protein Cas8c/Csd1 [Propionicimonas sp.]|uniref:type I-C CRISPR-associated protein Cas8c/Csd1 n=1 Tax=Propionicimonas sp. TaxID=1955623 RepID=UPI003D0D137B
MILNALSRYQPETGIVPPGYARKPLGFQLVITDRGAGCRLESLYTEQQDGKKSWAAHVRAVPDMTRSNNPPPLLACDNAAFVLGRPKPGADAGTDRQRESAAKKHGQFVQLLAEYRDDSGDADADAYLQWVQGGMPGLDAQVEALPPHAAKRLDLDLIAVKAEESDTLIVDKVRAQAFWARRAALAKGGGESRVCLCCGQVAPVVDTLPQALSGRWIPGTDTAQVALVSANFAAAMRGASGSGLKSVPICASCAGRAVAAFNDLASNSAHRFRLSDREAAIWWSTAAEVDDWIRQIDGVGDPQQVRELLASIHGGTKAHKPKGEFFLLVFSGNVARLVVRRWVSLELSGFEANVARWFDDVEVADRERPYRTPSAMARSLGPFPVGDHNETAPDGAFASFLMAALAGASPPAEYLRSAVARSVAEVRRLDGDDPWAARQRAMDRLAVIRLILNRTPTNKGHIMTALLDDARSDPAYLSGRIFAIGQSLQRAALGDVNASIVDRYFARAVQHPASVDAVLATLQMQHTASLRRKGSGALAHSYEVRIGELRARMGDAPGRLGLAEQAAWIAGYFQQRESAFSSAKASDRTQTKGRDDADRMIEEG